MSPVNRPGEPSRRRIPDRLISGANAESALTPAGLRDESEAELDVKRIFDTLLD
jgi:hypothetical protein